jgi:hypothetical protein
MGLKLEQLLEDEVEWELLYRKIGFQKQDKLSDKQRLLRTSVRAVTKGASEMRCELWEDLNLEEEQRVCERKYEEIEENLREKGQKSKEFGTFQSRLLHLERRIIALCRATQDAASKKEITQLLLDTRSLNNQFFGSDEAAKIPSGLSSQNDIFDIPSDQGQSDYDTSKGAIKKGTVKGLTEVVVHTKDQSEKEITEEQDRSEQMEERFKKMLSEMEIRISNLEVSESEASEDEIESLLKLQEKVKLRLEQVKLKKSKSNHERKNNESVVEKRKSNARQVVHSSMESPDSSDDKCTPKGTKVKIRTKKRDKHSDEEKGLRVEKWNFRYSSTGGLSLVEFLRRVDRYKETQNVSEETLVRKAFFLFEGVALDWYDENRHLFQKWKDVVDGLRKAFVSDDNDFLVRRKCESRLQQRHETFDVYMAQMNKLFQGLSYKISEEEKFGILKRNVKPSHRLGIALLKVTTLEELKEACRSLDNMDSSLYSLATDAPGQRSSGQNSRQICEIDNSGTEDQQKEGEKQKKKKNAKSKSKKMKEESVKTLEAISENQGSNHNSNGRGHFNGTQRDSSSGMRRFRKPFVNSYREKYSRNTGHVRQIDPMDDFSKSMTEFLKDLSNDVARQRPNESKKVQFPNPTAQEFTPAQTNIQTRVNPVNQDQQRVCWNCDGLNHHQRFCTAPRRVMCFGCGRKDTYRDQCPTCSGNAK